MPSSIVYLYLSYSYNELCVDSDILADGTSCWTWLYCCTFHDLMRNIPWYKKEWWK